MVFGDLEVGGASRGRHQPHAAYSRLDRDGVIFAVRNWSWFAGFGLAGAEATEGSLRSSEKLWLSRAAASSGRIMILI